MVSAESGQCQSVSKRALSSSRSRPHRIIMGEIFRTLASDLQPGERGGGRRRGRGGHKTSSKRSNSGDDGKYM